jgi:REP element-mobilizing transposase RayT
MVGIMGRPIRIEFKGALYHITSRGNERREIFLDEKDRAKFLSILADYHDRYGILIHAYVLMQDGGHPFKRHLSREKNIPLARRSVFLGRTMRLREWALL